MKLRAMVGGRAEVCGPETTLQVISEAMLTTHVGSLGVVDGRHLTGIITERDVLRAAAEGADPTMESARDWMTVDPDVFSPEVQVSEAAHWLLETGYRHMPVMEEGELLGIVSIKDILWALAGPLPGAEET
ncbi:inosine 5'-monophosphate dehydrogenase [bacterium BMS3Abin02]|nr:inosine 5'-monophosphate dehydrogenase [bacterium BMS3Abin02]GBE20830.1 inosine 5'-monophosphate dehydrogenase [bacterium BMS3Bbin01]HDK46258.1 CBS domain-containing protein [Actinomycetota bacterium]